MQRGHRWGQKRENDIRDRRVSFYGSCECSRCGLKMSNQSAVPCSSIPCPQCGTPMVESDWR